MEFLRTCGVVEVVVESAEETAVEGDKEFGSGEEDDDEVDFGGNRGGEGRGGVTVDTRGGREGKGEVFVVEDFRMDLGALLFSNFRLGIGVDCGVDVPCKDNNVGDEGGIAASRIPEDIDKGDVVDKAAEKAGEAEIISDCVEEEEEEEEEEEARTTSCATAFVILSLNDEKAIIPFTNPRNFVRPTTRET